MEATVEGNRVFFVRREKRVFMAIVRKIEDRAEIAVVAADALAAQYHVDTKEICANSTARYFNILRDYTYSSRDGDVFIFLKNDN